MAVSRGARIAIARGSNSSGELLQHPANHSEGMLPSKWPARLHTASRHRSLTREHRLRAGVWEQQRTTANNNRCRSFAALPSASLRAGRATLLRRSVISVQDSSLQEGIRVKDGCPDAVRRHSGALGGLHITERSAGCWSSSLAVAQLFPKTGPTVQVPVTAGEGSRR